MYRMPRIRSVAALLVAPLLSALLSGCTTPISGMRFVQDHRVRIVQPQALAKPSLPITFRWTSKFAPGQRYGLFINRNPIPPGHSLRDLAAGDSRCLTVPTCPDEQYLEALNVYVTDKLSVTVKSLPTPPRGEKVLTAQLILLGADGRRETESYWYVTFRTDQAFQADADS